MSYPTFVISAATNATPIQITTSTPHTLVNGATVTITGAVGNTAANGTWVITFLNTTQFTLNGSVGNGAYTANSATLFIYTFAVTAATAATPIQITTSLSHTLITGERVVIANVGGNTAANGTWTVTVINGTNFTLNGSIGINPFTSGGTVSFELIIVESSALNGLTLDSTDDGFSSNYGALLTLTGSSPFDSFTDTGFSGNFGGAVQSMGVLDITDYNPVKGSTPKNQVIYYKLKGFNASNSTYESWIITEDITVRPELYEPGDHPPNFDNGIYFTPPSGNNLTNVAIVAKWIQ